MEGAARANARGVGAARANASSVHSSAAGTADTGVYSVVFLLVLLPVAVVALFVYFQRLEAKRNSEDVSAASAADQSAADQLLDAAKVAGGKGIALNSSGVKVLRVGGMFWTTKHDENVVIRMDRTGEVYMNLQSVGKSGQDALVLELPSKKQARYIDLASLTEAKVSSRVVALWPVPLPSTETAQPLALIRSGSDGGFEVTSSGKVLLTISKPDHYGHAFVTGPSGNVEAVFSLGADSTRLTRMLLRIGADEITTVCAVLGSLKMIAALETA